MNVILEGFAENAVNSRIQQKQKQNNKKQAITYKNTSKIYTPNTPKSNKQNKELKLSYRTRTFTKILQKYTKYFKNTRNALKYTKYFKYTKYTKILQNSPKIHQILQNERPTSATK